MIARPALLRGLAALSLSPLLPPPPSEASDGLTTLPLSLCGGAYSVEQLVDAIRAQLGGGARTCEVMVHPGRRQLVRAWDAFDAAEAREHELASLCDPRMRAALEKFVHLSCPPTSSRR